MDKIDYERAFTILKAHHSNISLMFLDYVWDMPLLEFLAYLFSQKYPNKEKYERVLGMIQNPQLNEHNRDCLAFKFFFFFLNFYYFFLFIN